MNRDGFNPTPTQFTPSSGLIRHTHDRSLRLSGRTVWHSEQKRQRTSVLFVQMTIFTSDEWKKQTLNGKYCASALHLVLFVPTNWICFLNYIQTGHSNHPDLDRDAEAEEKRYMRHTGPLKNCIRAHLNERVLSFSLTSFISDRR